MISRVQSDWCSYEIRSIDGGCAVRLATLSVGHPEVLGVLMRQIAQDTLCSRVEAPSEIWRRHNLAWWHSAGFKPPVSMREGIMVWEPIYEQSSFLGRGM